MVIAGGFGTRGFLGKLFAIKWARENGVPLLGLCLGFQLAVIEYARNVLGITEANSEEMDPTTSHPVIAFMPEGSKTHLGGTMRLGGYETKLMGTSKTFALYEEFNTVQAGIISERHRHRYEVNPKYVAELEASRQLVFTGKDAKSGQRMEILELTGHPYFVATQFHPEFKSRIMAPSPLFVGLLRAAAAL